MFKLLLLAIFIYILYQGYKTYEIRGKSVSPLDEFFEAWLKKVQFWK